MSPLPRPAALPPPPHRPAWSFFSSCATQAVRCGAGSGRPSTSWPRRPPYPCPNPNPNPSPFIRQRQRQRPGPPAMISSLLVHAPPRPLVHRGSNVFASPSAMVDPDAMAPQWCAPFHNSCLAKLIRGWDRRHWLVINMPGAEVAAGETISPYRAPSPRAGSGPHRYVFLLYKQREKIESEQLNK
jgi:hypothetical protein